MVDEDVVDRCQWGSRKKTPPVPLRGARSGNKPGIGVPVNGENEVRSLVAVCRAQAPDWVASGQVDVAAAPRTSSKSDIYLPKRGAAVRLAFEECPGLGIRFRRRTRQECIPFGRVGRQERIPLPVPPRQGCRSCPEQDVARCRGWFMTLEVSEIMLT